MGTRALPLSSSQNCCSNSVKPLYKASSFRSKEAAIKVAYICATAAKKKDEGEQKSKKQSLFSSITEALDFSQTRSSQDAQLLEEAKQVTKSGGKMSKEQYGALRRKIGGTYKDFFKSYVDVEGQYTEEGWVDKTCKVCKGDTKGEPRQIDKLGRYVHVSCLGNSKSSNLFSKLFSK